MNEYRTCVIYIHNRKVSTGKSKVMSFAEKWMHVEITIVGN